MNNLGFCEIHKNNIAISRCSRCSRGFCSRCSVNVSSFCSKCRGVNILKVEKKHSKNEIRNILIAGFVMFLITFFLDFIFKDFELNITKKILFRSILFFAFGISIASAIYFVRKTDVFEDIQEIPLFGNKIIKYIIIGTSIVGLPIIYFFYLVYKFFKKEDDNSKLDKTKIKSNR